MIGASLGELIARARRIAITDDERRALVVAGASAGIAAVFSSPGVGALYGLEVPFRRDLDAPKLVPAAVAAAASFGTHAMLAGARQLVHYTGPTEIDALFLLGVIVLGAACGLGARLFAFALTELRSLARGGSPWTRALAGGVLLASLAWAGRELSGAWVTFGPGYIAAGWIEASHHAVPLLLVVLLIRTAGTLVSVWGGGGGGVFTSLACTGVFIGWLLGETLVPGSEQALALLGSATFLGAGYRIPLAGILLVAETSGELALTAAALGAIAIAQLIMGEASVSNAQLERRQ
jgi:CIC family chloride channel protein